MYHEHPLKVIKYASKNIWLLIFPLLRGIKTMSLDFDVFYSWLRGAWFDFIVLVFILGFGYLRWLFNLFSFDEKEVTFISGFLIKRKKVIPYQNISAVTSERSFWLKPFKAVRIKVSTRAGTFSNADLTLLMKKDEVWELHHKIPQIPHNKSKSFEIHPRPLTILFFSFVFSSSLSGALYISALLFQLGSVSKDLLEHELKDALNQISGAVSSRLALSIPPVAVILGILIILTWIMSFIFNLLRYSDFSMKNSGGSLRITMGILTRRSHYIITDKINYIDLRQSMIMKIFGMTSLNISCSGYGNNKNELPVLIPILSFRQANHALDILEFGKKIRRRSVRSEKKAVLTFLGIPASFCAGIPLAAFIISHFFPSVTQFVIPFAVFAEIPSVWMLIIKTMSLFKTGVSFNDDYICIRYSRFFAFHTVLAEKKRLVKVQIVQNPIQKLLGRCRLDFYFSAELPKNNKLYGIRLKDAESFLKKINGSD